jgi:hypothetical protein
MDVKVKRKPHLRKKFLVFLALFARLASKFADVLILIRLKIFKNKIDTAKETVKFDAADFESV